MKYLSARREIADLKGNYAYLATRFSKSDRSLS